MDFGEILSRSWKIIWKHKVLWIFGILASCSGSGNRFNFQGGGGNRSSYSERFPGDMPFPQIERYFDQLSQETLVWIIVGLIAIALVFVAVTVVLSTIGRIGLIRGTLQADQQEDVKLTFGGLLRESRPFFWRIFGLNLAVGLAMVALIVVLFVVPVLLIVAGMGFPENQFARGTEMVPFIAFTIIFLFCMCCILVPLGWLVGLVLQQAHNAIVIEDLGIQAGLRRGWDVLRANFVNIFLIWLIVGVGVSFIGGMIIAIPMIAAFMPFFMAVFADAERALITGMILSGICMVAYFPILLVLQGILQSYIQAAWTLTYLRLTRRTELALTPVEEMPG